LFKKAEKKENKTKLIEDFQFSPAAVHSTEESIIVFFFVDVKVDLRKISFLLTRK